MASGNQAEWVGFCRLFYEGCHKIHQPTTQNMNINTLNLIEDIKHQLIINKQKTHGSRNQKWAEFSPDQQQNQQGHKKAAGSPLQKEQDIRGTIYPGSCPG